jgi:S-methylmethionine-dependent homocysteine/selenocysteine methylase
MSKIKGLIKKNRIRFLQTSGFCFRPVDIFLIATISSVSEFRA